jgi:NADPH:quinone reductase-like Zn-dependent oxidoreductase
MKAIVADRFGPPDVLHLADAEPPAVGPGQVLIRVHAAALNPYDWHMLRGDPRIARLMPGGTGLRRPRHRVAGIDAAGTIEKIGPNVSGLSPGDEVFGFCPGAFAEYARAAAAALAPKPARLTPAPPQPRRWNIVVVRTTAMLHRRGSGPRSPGAGT